MATARLTAAGSVLAAATLVLTARIPPGAGLIALIGWTGLGLLAAGLAMGYRGGLAAASIAFVAQIAIAAPFGIELHPPLWAQAMLIVLMIELGSISFTSRTRPVDPLRVIARSAIVALGSAAVVESMGLVVSGARAGGSLVRVAGVAAAIIAGGWVARVWRRSSIGG